VSQSTFYSRTIKSGGTGPAAARSGHRPEAAAITDLACCGAMVPEEYPNRGRYALEILADIVVGFRKAIPFFIPTKLN